MSVVVTIVSGCLYRLINLLNLSPRLFYVADVTSLVSSAVPGAERCVDIWNLHPQMIRIRSQCMTIAIAPNLFHRSKCKKIAAFFWKKDYGKHTHYLLTICVSWTYRQSIILTTVQVIVVTGGNGIRWLSWLSSCQFSRTVCTCKMCNKISLVVGHALKNADSFRKCPKYERIAILNGI